MHKLPQLPRRRTIYLVAISLGMPALALLWWAYEADDPLLRVTLPLLGAYLAGAFATLWRDVGAVPRVERATYGVLTLMWLGGYVVGVLDLAAGRAAAGGWGQLVTTVMLNFFVLAVLAQLVFSTRTGFRANLALLAASSAVGLAALGPAALQGRAVREFVWLLQFEVAFAVVIHFVYALARSKDDHLAAELRARELRGFAYQDALTALPNRRWLDDELRRQVEVGQRYLRPLSLISFDLDRFKEINDSHGHPLGDAVLVAVARLVEPLLRSSDAFGRWGGEEFLVIAPETDAAKAQALAERIRRALEAADFPAGVRVTASFGVTTRQPGVTPEGLLAEVDERLYAAKQRGRNRVVHA